jgi:hypothetical protein
LAAKVESFSMREATV